jgi:Predicted transcriptional regulators
LYFSWWNLHVNLSPCCFCGPICRTGLTVELPIASISLTVCPVWVYGKFGPTREDITVEHKNTFGDYIQQKRKEAGLTQKSFAEKLYVTESAVSKWERGLSYPDISLIRDICAVLEISEHELLTASEDTQTRNNERLANKYLRLIQKFKWAQYILYGAALLTCFICNLAIQHTLSWFYIVLASVATSASLTLLPILLEKRRGLITLTVFTACLLVLLLVCNIYTGGDWFILTAVSILFGFYVIFLPLVIQEIWLPEALSRHKALICMTVDTLLLFPLLLVCNWFSNGSWFLGTALPIASIGIIFPWGLLLIIRYTKMNNFFKTAACLGLSSVLYYLVEDIIAAIIGDTKYNGFGHDFNLSQWNFETVEGNIDILILGILLCLTVLFAVAGVVVALRKKDDTHDESARQ